VLSEHLAAIVRDSPVGVVICDVRGITSPDASTIDVLARLQLTARRLGCGIRLYGVRPRLRDLLLITGLSEVLPESEVGWEAEEREDPLDVQE
jgi:anti-anti-sigma regulatory factor